MTSAGLKDAGALAAAPRNGQAIEISPENGAVTAPEPDLKARLAALESRLDRLEARQLRDKVTLVVFSGDLDKVMAALVIATGAAAMGLEVAIFHTFWGLMPLRRNRSIEGKGLLESALNLLTPAGLGELSPSRLAMAGAGARIFRKLMAEKGVQSPEELFSLARELGVRIIACEMSLDVMGISPQELVDGVEVGGVAAYLAEAADSRVTLFI